MMRSIETSKNPAGRIGRLLAESRSGRCSSWKSLGWYSPNFLQDLDAFILAIPYSYAVTAFELKSDFILPLTESIFYRYWTITPYAFPTSLP